MALVAPGLLAVVLGTSTATAATSKPADCDLAEMGKPSLDVRPVGGDTH